MGERANVTRPIRRTGGTFAGPTDGYAYGAIPPASYRAIPFSDPTSKPPFGS